jgi:hypothetical protein
VNVTNKVGIELYESNLDPANLRMAGHGNYVGSIEDLRKEIELYAMKPLHIDPNGHVVWSSDLCDPKKEDGPAIFLSASGLTSEEVYDILGIIPPPLGQGWEF